MVTPGPRFPDVTEGPHCSETGQQSESQDPDPASGSSASGLPEEPGPSRRWRSQTGLEPEREMGPQLGVLKGMVTAWFT